MTSCWGLSSSLRSFSLSGDPIVKAPAGTTTISGHWLQSLNTSPGPSAHSSSAESGTAVRDRIDTEIRPRPHGPDGTGDAVGAATAASLARGADGSSATGDARLVTSFRSSSFRARAIDPYGVSPNWRTKSSNTAMLVVFCVVSQTRPAGSTSTDGTAATVGSAPRLK